MEIITEVIMQATWAELKAAAEAGTIDEIISSGDVIPFTIRTGEKVAVRATRDEIGKLFFVFEDCLDDAHAMNKRDTNKGGWAACEMRKHLNKTVFALLPDDLQAVISPTHIVQVVDGERVETIDKLFLLSRTQVFGKGAWSEREPEDTQLDCFKREKTRVKECDDNGSWFWWLRSPWPSKSSAFAGVSGSGYSTDYYASAYYGVAPGFSI